jgi:hypothetical protein
VERGCGGAIAEQMREGRSSTGEGRGVRTLGGHGGRHGRAWCAGDARAWCPRGAGDGTGRERSEACRGGSLGAARRSRDARPRGSRALPVGVNRGERG